MNEDGKTTVVVGIILCAIFSLWLYNRDTSNEIQEDYGYDVTTSGVTGKPDCSSLEPNNPYNPGSGHYAGYEWGAEGKNCGGNSSSFIAGCEEYQNHELAYGVCLSR